MAAHKKSCPDTKFVFVGYDVIAQAQSGTGKTATFSISILEQIDVSSKYCQALVLAPTRELAQQVSYQILLTTLLLLIFMDTSLCKN